MATVPQVPHLGFRFDSVAGHSFFVLSIGCKDTQSFCICLKTLPLQLKYEYIPIMNTIIEDIRQALKDSIDPKTLAGSERYFKQGEAAKIHDVGMKEVGKIAKEGFHQIKTLPKQDIFGLCEELWKTGYLEESVAACNWAESLHKQYEPEDFNVFEHWVHNYLTNWADCDTLCNHTIGSFVMKYPEYIVKLKRWVTSTNRWVKRASAVTLIIPARKGLFLNDIFEIADLLLLDKDDLVQKGYGWMLKAASETHREEVFDYVMSKKEVMPRTAFRYAIEKMPADLWAEAMKK
jgi:3-methyladenine DNA glycosylase AlkD